MTIERSRDYHVRRLQAIQFMKERVLRGKSNVDIAKEYGVTRKTVERTLSWAERAGLFVHLEDKLLQEVAPLALDTIVHALKTSKDPDVALEVIKGLNLLKSRHPVTPKDIQDQDDLASYITATRAHAELEASTTDGELLDGPKPLLIPGYSPELLGLGDGEPAGSASVDADGPKRPSGSDGDPNEEAEAEKGEGSEQNRVPSPEKPPTDGPVAVGSQGN